PVELNVIDLNDPDQMSVHQTFMGSAAPARLKLGKGSLSSTRTVSVKAGNADVADAAGHGGTVTASNGSCPMGTVGQVDFDSGALGAQTLAAVGAAGTETGKAPVTVNASAFFSPNKRAPARCVLQFTGAGPSGDLDASNNTTQM